MDWSLFRFVTSGELRFRILVELRRGPLTPTELADMLGKSRSHVSRALAELSRRRLAKSHVPEKSRNRPYGITREGRQFLNQLAAFAGADSEDAGAHSRNGHIGEGGNGIEPWTAALATRIQRGGAKTMPAFKRTRILRIREAISLPAGSSPEEPLAHTVDTLPLGTPAVFLKPGKEASRKKPRPHDMAPLVPGYESARFSELWSPLARAWLAEREASTALAVLIYRSAYHLDQTVEDGGKVRYRPSSRVVKIIEEVDNRLKVLLPPGGVWGLLIFLDLLGWNEDVKYHLEDDQPTFTGRYPFRTGRVITLLTAIRVPYEVSRFAHHAANNAASPDRIGFERIIAVMQQFSSSRGTCVPTKEQLLRWLRPYLRA